MKKLMIAAAIVCAAAFAHGATASWLLSDLVDKNGSAASGYAYTFTTASTTIDAVTAALVATTDAATFSAALTSLGYVSQLSGSVSSGVYSSGDKVLSEAGIPTNTRQQLFSVVIDTATLTDESNWYITGLSNKTKTGASDDAIGAAEYTLSDEGSSTASNWTAVKAAPEPIPGGVPEPTSGLLVLLGVAGLALKRKRA